MKVFISQSMHGLTDDEVIVEVAYYTAFCYNDYWYETYNNLYDQIGLISKPEC